MKIKDMNGKTLKHGQKVKVIGGSMDGYVYTLFHILEEDNDPELHLDFWEIREISIDGECIKSKLAQFFSGKLKLIK